MEQQVQSRIIDENTHHKEPLLYLRTVSIHDYSQLSELKHSLIGNKPIILIARITPIMSQNPESGGKLLNELYSIATANNYSVFRLGEERIIVTPQSVQVEKREDIAYVKKHF
jgi:SepF-like predicted cell division protein (DUF552 family)